VPIKTPLWNKQRRKLINHSMYTCRGNWLKLRKRKLTESHHSVTSHKAGISKLTVQNCCKQQNEWINLHKHKKCDSQLSTTTIFTISWKQKCMTDDLEKWPFDAHCCHMGTAMKHSVPDRVKPSYVISDIRALWQSALSVTVPGCQKLQMAA